MMPVPWMSRQSNNGVLVVELGVVLVVELVVVLIQSSMVSPPVVIEGR